MLLPWLQLCQHLTNIKEADDRKFSAALWISIDFLRIRIQFFSQCESGSTLKKLQLNRISTVPKKQKRLLKSKKMDLVRIYFRIRIPNADPDPGGKMNADPDPQ